MFFDFLKFDWLWCVVVGGIFYFVMYVCLLWFYGKFIFMNEYMKYLVFMISLGIVDVQYVDQEMKQFFLGVMLYIVLKYMWWFV